MYDPSRRFCCLDVRVHVSEPYIRIGSMVALKRFILVSLWISERHILSSLFQAAQAIPLRALKSLFESMINEPRYLKSSTLLIRRPERAFKGGGVAEVVMNSVLVSLQMRPTAEAASSRDCKSDSAFETDSAVMARSSAKSKSVRY